MVGFLAHGWTHSLSKICDLIGSKPNRSCCCHESEETVWSPYPFVWRISVGLGLVQAECLLQLAAGQQDGLMN